MLYTVPKSHLKVLAVHIPHLVISTYGFIAVFININKEERMCQIAMKN